MCSAPASRPSERPRRSPADAGRPAHPLLLGPRHDVARRMIAATVEVIDESGETSVRVQDIVERIGVQAPVLYRHFGNREGLIMAAQATRLVGDMQYEVERFSVAVLAAESIEHFDQLLGALVAVIAAPERRSLRWKRVNVVGSTYGRPELAAAVAELQHITISAIAGAFAPAQERGWIAPDVDLHAAAALLAAQSMGRILIELGETSVSDEAWNLAAYRSLRAMLLA